MKKQGKWSLPKIVLLVDNEARLVTVPGKNGKRVTAVFEDVRPALPDESFAMSIQVSGFRSPP